MARANRAAYPPMRTYPAGGPAVVCTHTDGAASRTTSGTGEDSRIPRASSPGPSDVPVAPLDAVRPSRTHAPASRPGKTGDAGASGEVAGLFPDQPLGGFAPGGVRDGHMEGSAHYDGRAVDVFVRPVNATNRTRGWAIAQWLVSQAARLEISTVIFDDRIWTARRSDEGWRDYDVPSRSGDRAILEHRDHVHVDVFD